MNTTSLTGTNPACNWCGSILAHPVESCPQVGAVEYDEQGRIRRVERRQLPPIVSTPWQPVNPGQPWEPPPPVQPTWTGPLRFTCEADDITTKAEER